MNNAKSTAIEETADKLKTWAEQNLVPQIAVNYSYWNSFLSIFESTDRMVVRMCEAARLESLHGAKLARQFEANELQSFDFFLETQIKHSWCEKEALKKTLHTFAHALLGAIGLGAVFFSIETFKSVISAISTLALLVAMFMTGLFWQAMLRHRIYFALGRACRLALNGCRAGTADD